MVRPARAGRYVFGSRQVACPQGDFHESALQWAVGHRPDWNHSSLDCAGWDEPRAGAGAGARQGELHEVRASHSHARWNAVVHFRLCAQRLVAEVPDPHDAHPLRRAPLWRGSAEVRPGSVAGVRQAGLHFRLSGRARAVDVGGGIRQHASAQSRQGRGQGPARRARSRRLASPRGRGREQRHVRHDRLARGTLAVPQRQGGDVGYFVSRLLRRRGNDRCPSGACGLLASGARHGLVRRRRLAPQRRAHAFACFQLPRAIRPSAPAAGQEIRL